MEEQNCGDSVIITRRKGKKHRNFSKFGVASLILSVLLVVLLLLNVGPLALVAATKKIPVYCVDSDKKQVALTFDAAWGADKTKQILDVCDSYGVKVTFFLVGFWSEKYPELVKEISDRGHAIGTHSETHPKMGGMSAENIAQELNSSVKKITDVTNISVKLFRAPFGDYSNTLIETAESLGLLTIQWSVDSLDWKGLSGAAIAQRVLKAKDGDIILCHNNSDHIVDALPVILTGLKDKGLSVCRVDQMVFFENYYVDHTGRQFLNKTDAN